MLHDGAPSVDWKSLSPPARGDQAPAGRVATTRKLAAACRHLPQGVDLAHSGPFWTLATLRQYLTVCRASRDAPHRVEGAEEGVLLRGRHADRVEGPPNPKGVVAGRARGEPPARGRLGDGVSTRD